MSERLAQRVALLATVDPYGVSSTQTITCDTIDASLYDSLMFVMSIGNITSSGKITMTVYKGTATGTISSAVATVTSPQALTPDKQFIVDVDVSAEGSYRYYKGVMVANDETTTGGAIASMHVFGSKARFHPASDNDLASVSITYA